MKKQLFSTKNKQQLVTLIMLLVSLFMFTTSLVIYKASRPVVYEYGVYKLGTSIASGDVLTTINKISYENGGGGVTAPASKRYMILDVTFENTSNKPVTILPSTDMYIKTTDGRVFYASPFALEQPFRAGMLKAGDKITGEISFLVPNQTSYTLYIDSSWSGGVVSVRLT